MPLPDDMNMSDKYRLSPSTGVPRTRSKPPPIGGTSVAPTGGGDYGVGGPTAGPARFATYPGEAAAHASFAAEQRLPGMVGQQPPLSTPGRFPPRSPSLPTPSAAVHGPDDDLILAYQGMTSGFPADPGIPSYQPPPGLGPAGQADTFAPAMQEAARLHASVGGGHTGAGADETPLVKMLNKNADFMLGRPSLPAVPWKGLAQDSAVGAGLSAVADPHGFADMATHPLNTLGAVGDAVVNPQQSWGGPFGAGFNQLKDNYMNTDLDLGNAIGQSLGMKAALDGGINMGRTIKKYANPATFGRGNLARDLAAGMGVIGNKISDAWHDPGGGFGK